MQLLKKIDIHVHTATRQILPVWATARRALPHELREIYDQFNIEKGVILPSAAPECGKPGGGGSNEEIYEVVNANPNDFYWFCNIDPRWAGNSDKTDFVPYLEHYKSLGAKGVGELTANLYFDDPIFLNFFRACEKVDMPVTFHIGNLGGDYGIVDDMGLPRLEKCLQMFPKLTFLGHSQKFWAEISGDLTKEQRDGYPTGPVTPGGRVVELMRKYPNLCGDLSAGSGFNAISRDPEFGYKFFEEFQDRLFFGTDICNPKDVNDSRVKLSKYLDDAVVAGKISYAAYEKISRGNALKLLER